MFAEEMSALLRSAPSRLRPLELRAAEQCAVQIRVGKIRSAEVNPRPRISLHSLQTAIPCRSKARCSAFAMNKNSLGRWGPLNLGSRLNSRV